MGNPNRQVFNPDTKGVDHGEGNDPRVSRRGFMSMMVGGVAASGLAACGGETPQTAATVSPEASPESTPSATPTAEQTTAKPTPSVEASPTPTVVAPTETSTAPEMETPPEGAIHINDAWQYLHDLNLRDMRINNKDAHPLSRYFKTRANIAAVWWANDSEFNSAADLSGFPLGADYGGNPIFHSIDQMNAFQLFGAAYPLGRIFTQTESGKASSTSIDNGEPLNHEMAGEQLALIFSPGLHVTSGEQRDYLYSRQSDIGGEMHLTKEIKTFRPAEIDGLKYGATVREGDPLVVDDESFRTKIIEYTGTDGRRRRNSVMLVPVTQVVYSEEESVNRIPEIHPKGFDKMAWDPETGLPIARDKDGKIVYDANGKPESIYIPFPLGEIVIGDTA